MKKIFIIIVILLILVFISLFNLEAIRSTAKKYLPTETKRLVKKLFFGEERLKEFEQLATYGLMNYNQVLLPETQFVYINFREVLLDKLSIEKDSSYGELANLSLTRKFFMEQFNDNVIIVDGLGKIFFFNKKFISDIKDFNLVQIESNLYSQDIRVNDVLILNNEIYISYAEFGTEAKDCRTLNISKAKISKNKLDFEIFFKSKECRPGGTAGTMVFYNHEGKDGLLLTTGISSAAGKQRNLAQDDNSLWGKILFIDFETNNYIIFSKGHRVPQGLTTENNFILSAEHGPRGGDEINLIQFGKNYGWPLSSYGEPYFYGVRTKRTEEKNYLDMPRYLKNHSNHGFIEPIYSFVPSIATNQIIKVPDNFSNHWKNNFLVTSLEGRQIQRILFDKNFTKLIFNEKIYIGSRIRDICYIKEFNVFLLALEGDASPGANQIPSIGILSNSLNN